MLNEDEKAYLCVSTEEMEPVKSFFLNAIQAKSSYPSERLRDQIFMTKGDAYLYTHLVQQLRSRDDPDTLFRVYLAMTSFVTRITSQYATSLLFNLSSFMMKCRPRVYRELIQSLYTFDWNMEDRVVVAFINLLGQIVSSNPIFLIPSLQMLVKNFLPSQLAVEEFVGLTEDVQKNAWVIRHERKQNRLHRAIQNIVYVVPTAQFELFPLCQEYFPHKRHHVLIQTEYITQLLIFCKNFPSLQLKILDLIIGKCLEVDVEIVIEESGDVLLCKDEEGGGLFDNADDDDMFKLDDNHEHSGQSTSSFPPVGGGIGSSLKIRDDVTEMAEKLDSMLCAVVKFAIESSSTDKIFSQMFNIFESKILTTYKSKFVQYIMFILCKRHPQKGVAFAQRLVELFVDMKNHHLCRQSSVLYLASFLARANFMSQSVTSDIVSFLISWCELYVTYDGNENAMSVPGQDRNNSTSTPLTSTAEDTSFVDYSSRHIESKRISDDQNIHKHETFYTAVQACCYIVCYHGVSLATIIKESKRDQQNWELVMTSKYHPLKFCLQSVRVEFLRLARAIAMFPSVDSVVSVPSDKKFGGDKLLSDNRQGLNPLDSFFPFDPCLLSRVHEYVEGGYVTWNGIRGLDYQPSSASANNFVGEAEEDDIENNAGESIVSSVSSSMTNLSVAGQSYGIAMSMGVSYNAASSLASTYGSGPNQLYEQAGHSDINSSPLNIRVLEKRTRQYSVGSTGSW